MPKMRRAVFQMGATFYPAHGRGSWKLYKPPLTLYQTASNRSHGERRIMPQPLPQKQKINWPDNTYYFLTTSTFLHYPYFKTAEQKQIILNQIKQVKQSFHIPISAFSIAINHFHLKFYLEKGELMSKIKNMLHGGISREYQKAYDIQGRDLWQSTRTYYIKNEEISWKITGYIIGNLLKHHEVSTFDELKENPFSSYKYMAEKLGEETAQELIRSVININEDAEGVVDIEELNKIKIQRFK